MNYCVCRGHFGIFGIVAIALTSVGQVTFGASIDFADPVAITSDDILDQPGTVVHAGLFGVGPRTVITPGSTTINFVVTPGEETQAASGTTTKMFGTAAYFAIQEGIFDNDPMIVSDEFDNVLDAFSYGPNLENTHGTLRLGGLTIGRSYTIQLLSADDRAGSAYVQFADSTDRTGLTGNASVRFSPSTNPSIIGSFTATDVFQDVFVFGFANSTDADVNGFAQTLNGYVLRDVTQVPEPPASTILFLGGMVLTQLRVRERGKAGLLG
jgi:hypothetical protein